MKEAGYWIDKLELKKHPEGGWFKEVYRAETVVQGKDFKGGLKGDRNISTSIYYLLQDDDFSAFHRIKSDEIWHFYTGSSEVEIVTLEQGSMKTHNLGNATGGDVNFQLVVPANTWFAARLTNRKGYALVGCTVSPGFDFNDFEMASIRLADSYPAIKNEVLELIR